jgi:methionyl-tRNA synthetase
VAEDWFFRLSRYAGQLKDLISGGRLRIEPASRRNEILALITGGLHDFSVSRSRSRSRTRAHGWDWDWGIPVPGDPDQVIYAWWDALGNYVTSLGYGTNHPGPATWWNESTRRIHLAGKGVIRFHAVCWPAMLLSAGLPLPTDILVHDYLTIDGKKISESSGGAVPDQAVPTPATERLEKACTEAPETITAALDAFDFRRATAAIWTIVEEANRTIEAAPPLATRQGRTRRRHRGSGDRRRRNCDIERQAGKSVIIEKLPAGRVSDNLINAGQGNAKTAGSPRTDNRCPFSLGLPILSEVFRATS